jgi:hypothetical protein
VTSASNVSSGFIQIFAPYNTDGYFMGTTKSSSGTWTTAISSDIEYTSTGFKLKASKNQTNVTYIWTAIG